MFQFIIRRFKGSNFILDKRVPNLYLNSFFLENGFKYIRGIIKFHFFKKKILLGKKTIIKAKSKIIFLGENIHIDRDCYIDALSVEGVKLGNNVSIQKRVVIECTGSLQHLGKGLVLGDNVGVGSSSFLGCAGGIEIGNNTIIGNFVSFHSENHNYKEKDIPIRLQGVNHRGINVGKNCWIGAKATILDGTILSDGCIVAAGAVVNGKEYPKNSIIGGVPAKILKNRYT